MNPSLDVRRLVRGDQWRGLTRRTGQHSEPPGVRAIPWQLTAQSARP